MMENPFKKAVKNDENNIEETTPVVEESAVEAETEVEVEEKKDEKNEEVVSEVNEWQQKYEALNNQYIRLAADFDNYRKRQEQDGYIDCLKLHIFVATQ